MEVGSSSLPGTTSHSTLSHFGGLAQLARAPALQAGGQRFESVILHYPENWMTKAQASVNPEPDTREGVYLEEIFDILTQARL